MSCHGCARNFNFLNKEHGCEACGFSYCSKCLNSKKCKKCTTKTSTPSVSPLPVLEKKLERLENPNKSPITVYREEPPSRLSGLKRGLSAEDQALVDRLSKLKHEVKEMKAIPSQEEIEERLAKLKGINPVVYKKPTVLARPKVSNVDSVTELLNQVAEETAIDLQSDQPVNTNIPPHTEEEENSVEALLKREAAVIEYEAKMELENLQRDKEIQERLRKLKVGREKKEEEKTSCDDSEDDDMQASKIMKQAIAENRLELDQEELSGGVDVDDELPWCQLCNEDAQLRCIDCDRDLYCRRCWKETHTDSDLKRHHIEKYTPPK